GSVKCVPVWLKVPLTESELNELIGAAAGTVNPDSWKLPCATRPPKVRPRLVKLRLNAWLVNVGGRPPVTGVSDAGDVPVMSQVNGAPATLPVECQSNTQS